jgi:hypothetical protein
MLHLSRLMRFVDVERAACRPPLVEVRRGRLVVVSRLGAERSSHLTTDAGEGL